MRMFYRGKNKGIVHFVFFFFSQQNVRAGAVLLSVVTRNGLTATDGQTFRHTASLNETSR